MQAKNHTLKFAAIAVALGVSYVALVAGNTSSSHSKPQLASTDIPAAASVVTNQTQTAKSEAVIAQLAPQTPPSSAGPAPTSSTPDQQQAQATPSAPETAPPQQAPAAAPSQPAQEPAAPSAAAAPAPADPATVAKAVGDWPCVQVKVHTIDEVAVWDGPSVAEIKDWFNDSAISDLVRKVVSRRTPLADAEKDVEAYAKSIPEAERDAKLASLFAGVLSTANNQRNSIMSGIERFQKRQVQNAKEIEKQGDEIAKLEENAPSDLTIPTPEIDKARERYDWFARVFQERQSNIPIACELPTLIEQRVFALARAIRMHMKS